MPLKYGLNNKIALNHSKSQSALKRTVRYVYKLTLNKATLIRG